MPRVTDAQESIAASRALGGHRGPGFGASQSGGVNVPIGEESEQQKQVGEVQGSAGHNSGFHK